MINQPDNPQLKSSSGSNVVTFLNSWYGGADYYDVTDSVTTWEGDSTIIVYAITKYGEELETGYIAIDSATGSTYYFADVDRTNHELTYVDIENSDTTITIDIDLFEDYQSTDELDMIGTINDVNNNILGKRKFWGWSRLEPVDPSNPCDETGHGFQVRTYYVFWQAVAWDRQYLPCP